MADDELRIPNLDEQLHEEPEEPVADENNDQTDIVDDGSVKGEGSTLLADSDIEEHVSKYRNLPPIQNDEGFTVTFGERENYSSVVYCGRNLGRDTIPGSDGRCGPDDGPQCESCKRLQHGPFRVDIMSRKFPGLPREAFVGALRAKGGLMDVAMEHLSEDLGAKECEMESRLVLLPPQDQAGRETTGTEPGEDQVVNLMEMFQVDLDIANIAMRRNQNNTERAGEWILDTAQEDIANAVREWEDELASKQGELETLQNNQAEELRRVLRAAVPSDVLQIAEKVSISEQDRKDASWVMNDNGKTAVTKGQHFMSRLSSSSHCFHCAATLPCGSYRCDICQLCEGCVLNAVVSVCPRLFNGGHIHPHPLTYDPNRAEGRRACCDMNGSRCERYKNVWKCVECNFDSCYECIKMSQPENFDRTANTVINSAAEDAAEAAHESIFPAFDAYLSERGAAARWEGNYMEEDEVNMVIGTGNVENVSPEPFDPHRNGAPYEEGNRRGGRLVQRNNNFHRTPTLLTETKLHYFAAYALEQFKKPKRVSGGAEHVIAAADVTQAETILHRLQVVGDKATKRAVCEAIASGRLDIGGTLLLSEAFAPVPADHNEDGEDDNNQDSDSANTKMCLCCQEPIDIDTAPDGAVGCLFGHAMHSSCASDLLLGGGRCPVCDIPLFYAKVPQTEANAAAKMAATELARIQEKEAEKRKLQEKHSAAIEKGDIVRVSSDADLCAKTQARSPLSGGWDKDLAIHCGNEFCVTEIATCGSQIQALPLPGKRHALVPWYGRRCKSCNSQGPSRQTGNTKCKICSLCQHCCLKSGGLCDSGSKCIAWDRSLVTLVRRAGSTPVGEEACVDIEELMTKDAKNHLIRLKAELAAVKGARENTKASLMLRPTTITRELTANSEEAILYALDKVSPADWYRARHLLLLARLWGESLEAKRRRAQLYNLVREGSLDSVARIVRRYNAAQTMEEAKWADAQHLTHEYIVTPDANVQLLAFPAKSAPLTGFSLGPKTHFFSKKEVIDSNGIMWLQVSEKNAFDQSSLEGDVCYDGTSSSVNIVGARVVRGAKWVYRDQDGGKGTKGTIVAAKAGYVVVEWDGSPRLYNYSASIRDRQLAYARHPLPPPPQGWVCCRPLGPGSSPIVKLARSPFRCFACGDGLVAPRLGTGSFEPAEQIEVGDKLYVASTLEAVKVERVTSGRVYCSFALGVEDMDVDDSQECSIWYRPEDLLAQHRHEEGKKISDEARVVQGIPCTRRELVLNFGGDVKKAKAVWDEASKEKASVALNEDCNFASCARGHLLHARCLQGALLSGQSCPCDGCNEPLYLPQIKDQQDETTCCSARSDNNDGAELETLEAMAEIVDHTTGSYNENQAGEGDFTSAGMRHLKMCPSCCAGPLLNTHCSDMRSHHGQCTTFALGDREGRCGPDGIFKASESEIIAATMRIGEDQSVADVLPRCPTHNVIVMFNGCMACGHLFTDIDWDAMPQYDPKAKALFELDKKKRKAAMLLAEQIRMESTMLEFERSALWKLQEDERLLSGEASPTRTKKKKIEPPKVPDVPSYQVNLHEPENSITRNGNGAPAELLRRMRRQVT